MSERLQDETAISFYPRFREYSIPVLDGGSSSVVLAYCPWCGAALPKQLRDDWFDAIEALGLDPEGSHLPESFLSDAWWKMKPEHT
jgi:hypothetical protein